MKRTEGAGRRSHGECEGDRTVRGKRHALMPRGWNSIRAEGRKQTGWLCQGANLGGDRVIAMVVIGLGT